MTIDRKRYLTLSEREQEIQRVLGEHHRKILSDLLGDRVSAHVPPEGKERHIGVMLSGGIDSNSVIIGLIHDCGIMPDSTWTVTVPDENGEPVMSRDIRRAIAVSEHYGIRHHLLTLPEDHAEAVQAMIRVATDKFPGMEPLNSVPDFEVVPMLVKCIEEMDKAGVTLVFSGVRDGGIHMANGKDGRLNKNPLTAYTHYRVNADFLYQCGQTSPQTDYMTHLARSKFDMELCFPHAIVAAQWPYFDTPWRIINRPREKWVSSRAYGKELREAVGTDKPYMNPMQCGDSGIKAYYARAFSGEGGRVASEWAGRKVGSSLQFVSDLRKVAALNNELDFNEYGFDYVPDVGVDDEGIKDFEAASQDRELSDHMNATYGNHNSRVGWISYISTGGKTKLPTGKLKIEDGRSTLEYIPDEDPGSGGLFEEAFGSPDEGPIDRESFYLNEDDEIDDRVDCTGQPFHRGSAFAQVYCERAQAGLCGKPAKSFEEQPNLHKCTLFDSRCVDAGSVVFREQLATLPHLRESNARWAQSSMEVARLIKTGFSACIREAENVFPRVDP